MAVPINEKPQGKVETLRRKSRRSARAAADQMPEPGAKGSTQEAVSLPCGSTMAMFITQDTFDEVVKENMEDFGMDRQSAAEDAIGQFKAQGATQKD